MKLTTNVGGQAGGRTDGHTVRWTDKRTVGWTDTVSPSSHCSPKQKWTGRRKDGHSHRLGPVTYFSYVLCANLVFVGILIEVGFHCRVGATGVGIGVGVSHRGVGRSVGVSHRVIDVDSFDSSPPVFNFLIISVSLFVIFFKVSFFVVFTAVILSVILCLPARVTFKI